MVGAQAQRLLERDDELACIDELIAAASGGVGAVAVIDGAAGFGKTSLLESARTRAAAAGMRVLHARGGELEHDFSYGVAMQLFEPLLREYGEDARETLFAGPAALAAGVIGASELLPVASQYAALHGLYWLAVNVAAVRPLLLAIDDAHWADPPSLRYLLYVAQRIEGLPVLVLMATRPGEPGVDVATLDAIAASSSTPVLSPAPLSDQAVHELVRARWPDAHDEAFVQAARAATGGVPFLIHELLQSVAADGLAPDASSAGSLHELSSSGVARATVQRLERLGPEAADVARAASVLGRQATVRHLAALAHLAPDDTLAAIDRLVGAGILERAEPVRFAHPILRAAVYDEIPGGARSAAHARTASMLGEEGTPAEEVGQHLLLVTPGEDAGTLEWLRAAAVSALARGGGESSAAFLRRAVAEAHEPALRSELLHDLGRTELLLQDPGALPHLQEALRLAPGPEQRARVTLDLAQVLMWVADWDGLSSVLANALAEVGGRADELEAKLEAYAAAKLAYDPRGVDEYDRRRDYLLSLADRVGGEAGDTLALLLASISTSRGERLADSAALAAQVLDGGGHIARVGGEHWSLPQGIVALVFNEEIEAAHQASEAMADDGRRRGSVTAFMLGIGHRGFGETRRGNLVAAEADLRAAIGLMEQEHQSFMLPSAVWYYCDALLEREGLGDIASLARGLELPPQLARTMTEAIVLDGRGRLKLAGGDRAGAIADLRAAGTIFTAMRMVNPAISPWRSQLALALGRGDSSEPAALVEEELALARSAGFPRAEGVALRAAGLLAGAEGIAALSESCELLARSPARLELARSLVELGAALRRGNQRTAARERLRQGLDLAQSCGAERLAARAEEELRASGARPRRRRVSGADALTPSEARVARMAAAGMSNREIAQSLFVTPKTVENQLGRVYAKLGASGREALPEALGQA
jgi:DNA-binding CsgD family transcriptional regulator